MISDLLASCEGTLSRRSIQPGRTEPYLFVTSLVTLLETLLARRGFES
jgi:hypothetical protein